jgi:sarcosine oxidase subunit alpha
MGYREILLGRDVLAKVLRLGFVGELSYELHVPASLTSSVWEWLMEAGKDFGIQPFGLEAQSTLRLEKGHVIIGQESEQRTNLLDLDMGYLWARNDSASKKVGAPALRFTENQPNRLKLVGFQIDDPPPKPDDGSVVYEGDEIKGLVCTCRYSFTLNKIIGLALVQAPLKKDGTILQIYQNDGRGSKHYTATVIPTPFYDAAGQRLRM